MPFDSFSTDVLSTAVALVCFFLGGALGCELYLCLIGLPIRFLILLVKRNDRKTIEQLKAKVIELESICNSQVKPVNDTEHN